MYISKLDEINRRAFLKRSSQLAGAGVALPWAMNMSLVSEAAAFNGTGGYRALVCVFLLGGNDNGNTLIPFDNANYDLYSTIRGGGPGRTAGGIARAQADLAATALTPAVPQTLTDNIRYALAPELPLLKQRFDARNLAIQLNVGTLIRPTTVAQYNNQDRIANPLPPRLFSHNDQQSFWQSSEPEGARSGWGGRLADIAQSSNTNALFTAISPAGNAVFLTGNSAINYQISSSGAIRLNGTSNPLYSSTVARDMMRAIVTASSSQVMENDYARITQRSITAEGTFNTAVQGVNLTTSFTQPNVSNNLASQLQVVARTIAARQALGTTRQVFFVTMGGYDNHDGLVDAHPRLLSQLDFALNAFYQATVELGVADRVTTFTASDFGRTLASNGDGSDHGWGSHHFVLGGAVRGGRYFGTAPHVSVTTDDQVGQGRLLPSTSVDQYGSTLARWFGAETTELASLFPNVGNFSNTNLGFLG